MTMRFVLEAWHFPEEQPGADTVDLLRVLGEVADERWRQDVRWGGPKHDDTHTPGQWLSAINAHIAEAGLHLIRPPGVGEYAAPDYRRIVVQIAALAVAAAQSFDRRHAPGEAGEVIHPEPAEG